MAVDFRLLDPNAAARGIENVNIWAERAARMRAGRALADNDQVGAQNVLYQNGMMGDAREIQADINNAQDRQFKIEDRGIAADARVKTEEDRQRRIQMEDEKREAEVLGTMATNLQTVLTEQGQGAVLPAFEGMAKTWMANGAEPEAIEQMRQGLANNPEAFLTSVAGAVTAANQRYQLWNAGSSVGTFDKRTGKVTEQFRAPEFKTVGQGQDLVQIDGSAAPSGGDAALPTGGPAGSAERLEAPNTRAALETLFPGVRVTGGDRSVERNRTVGGATRSHHLVPGRAVDMAPIPGETIESVANKLKAAGWTVHEALDETKQTNGTGPHWHIAASPPAAGTTPQQPQQVSATPGGARVIARGQPRAPAAQWQQLSPEETAAAGFRPGTTVQRNVATGQTQVIQQPAGGSSGGSSGGSGGAGGKLPVQQEKFIADLRKSADELSKTSGLYTEWMQLNRQIETGGIMAMPGAAIARGAIDPRVSRMNSIQAALTPQMRQGMPGAASDRDVQMFGRATVNVGQPREANEATARAGVAFATRQRDYVAFLEQYARDNGTIMGAQEKWGEYLEANPLFSQGSNGMIRVNAWRPWRQFFTGGLRANNGGAAQTATPRPQGTPQRRRYNPATRSFD